MTDTNVILAHPRTGELLTPLDQQPPETLAGLHHELKTIRDQSRTLLSEVEQELRRRLKLRGRTLMSFGDWDVQVDGREGVQWESEWDGDELETVLRELVDEGVLNASELTGVIHREVKVSRSEATRVLGRLSGGPRQRLEGCRKWRKKGLGRLHVTRAAALISDQAGQENADRL